MNTLLRPTLLPAGLPIEGLNFNPGLTEYTDAQGGTWALPYRADFMRFINEKYEAYRTSAAKFHEAIIRSNTTASGDLPPFKYQEFIREYLRYGTPYRGLLLEHGLGSGKTRTAIMVAETFRAVGIRTLILTPAFLATNFKGEIKKWAGLTEAEINAGYFFVSYNAGGRAGGQGSVLEQLAKLGIGFPDGDPRWREFPYLAERYSGLGPPQHWFIVIEEMHGLNRSFRTTGGKIRRELYRLLLEARDCKILGLSGTPMIEPFELGTLYNVLRGPIAAGGRTHYAFPETDGDFNRKFLGKNAQGDEILVNPDVFQKRICGLHSYFRGVSTDISGKIYPKADPHEVLLDMAEYQQRIYAKYAVLPAAKRPKTRSKRKVEGVEGAEGVEGVEGAEGADRKPLASNFLSRERKMCNFAFPEEFYQADQVKSADEGGQTYVQATRAKLQRLVGIPGVFSLDPEAGLRQYSCKMYAIYMNLADPVQGAAHIVCHAERIIEPPVILAADAPEFIGDPEAIHDGADDPDEWVEPVELPLADPFDPLGRPALADIYLTDAVLNAKYGHGRWTIVGGPVMIYSFFSAMEGAGIFSKLLEAHGFTQYRPLPVVDPAVLPRAQRYAFIRGGMTASQKENLLRVFNHRANEHGQLIKVIFVTLAAVEGISLFHLRQIHIMEPYWDRNIIRQVTGRGFRLKSHFYLPEEECTIGVYEYTARCHGIDTADVLIRDLAERKDRFQEDFKALRMSAAVDCGINLNHHPGVTCFEFETAADGYIYHADVNTDTALVPKRRAVPVHRVKTTHRTLIWNPEEYHNIRVSHPVSGEPIRVTSVHRVYDEANRTVVLLYVKTHDQAPGNVFYRAGGPHFREE